ncbi:MAG: hypothetical protein Q9M30_03130 [Mariprofundaceae bacterium]|nr:hypothetical protein [Mariprofundaceae bacterium]
MRAHLSKPNIGLSKLPPDIIKDISEKHVITYRHKAMHLIYRFKEKEPVGLLYKSHRPTLDTTMADLVTQAGGCKDYVALRRLIN